MSEKPYRKHPPDLDWGFIYGILFSAGVWGLIGWWSGGWRDPPGARPPRGSSVSETSYPVSMSSRISLPVVLWSQIVLCVQTSEDWRLKQLIEQAVAEDKAEPS